MKNMRNIPHFTLLRAFESAARLKSFTLAAQELHLTQSAISHQVRKLEDYFGCALFIRRNRRVELTLEGQRFLESLSRIFDVIEAACAEVSLAPKAQVLALYCAPSLAVKWLGPKLPQFMKAHPDITIRLTTGSEQVDLVRMRELDISICYGTIIDRAGIVNEPLGTERNVPLCSPSLIEPGADAAALIKKLLLIDSQLNNVTWASWFTLNNLRLPARPRPSFDRAAMSLSAATDGMGVALESTRLAERELARGDLIELGKGVFKEMDVVTHTVSWRADESQVPKIRIFKDWLYQIAKTQPT